jgi:LmbE family N-acetylglucosaminyl deacetylase
MSTSSEAGVAPPDLAPFRIESHRLGAAFAPRRLLVVYAHPDDESFGNAGVIARYGAQGVAVHYVCATRGEAGTIAPRFLEDGAGAGALRTGELLCAAGALRLRGVHFLGYRDSGMSGSDDNRNPAALAQAPLEQVTAQVVAAMRALRPQVVLTFDPYGGYGHPDHIHVHRATLAAFAAAGDPLRFPAQIDAGLAAWRPRKLYYPTLPTAGLRLALLAMRLTRRDPRRFGENADVDLVRALEEATPVTAVVDCGAYLDQIDAAWRCHASQIGGMSAFTRLPRPIRRRLSGRERFTRAVPRPRPGRRERDLFAGIRGD